MCLQKQYIITAMKSIIKEWFTMVYYDGADHVLSSNINNFKNWRPTLNTVES